MKLISGLAAVAVAASTLAVAAPAQAAQTAGDRAVAAGATWLKGQLTDGIIHNEEYEFDDLGLSADVAFALNAVGGQQAAVTQVVDAVEPNTESWVGGTTVERIYAGSLAKLVTLVQVGGREPSSFNGTDQLARLEGRISSTPGLNGRLQDAGVGSDPAQPWDEDFVNVIGQSFAARALTTADSDRADAATTFLLDQQCDDGSFRAALTKDTAAEDQGCSTGATGEVDTTALTVINIIGTPGASVTAKGAAHLAASWLKSQQAADGSFSAGSLGTNANSTGLAGWALGATGHDAAATRAAAWLRGLQVADLGPCATTLSAQNGAVAYKPADLAAARAAGTIAVPAQDGFRRATAQALPALAHLPAGGDVTISAPATAVEKSTVTINVAGLGAGEPACVSFGTQATQVTGTGSAVPVTFTLPAGAATHTFRVATLTGTATATTAASLIPPAEPVVGDLDVAKVVKVGKRNTFKVAIACDSTVDCVGKLKVRTVGKIERADGTKKVLVVAKKAYTVGAGETAKVRLALTKPARAVLGTKRIRVVAVQTAAGADPARTKFWLRRK